MVSGCGDGGQYGFVDEETCGMVWGVVFGCGLGGNEIVFGVGREVRCFESNFLETKDVDFVGSAEVKDLVDMVCVDEFEVGVVGGNYQVLLGLHDFFRSHKSYLWIILGLDSRSKAIEGKITQNY